MLKEISALKARQNLGQVINEAGLREDELLKEVREFTENKLPNFKIIPSYYKVL
ncbi:MAG: hypothetical protein LWX52_12795 [Deltaproteobacteria bacterium]|nr:hypothetical protein [Deltaproteobacteria bacterium]